jgi:hypothetical protein
VGQFSREQIETMRRVDVLRKACTDGVEFSSWLSEMVACFVPVSYQATVHRVAAQVANMYPSSRLTGFAADIHVAALYRLQPPQWLNDELIRAMCERLAQAHPTVRYVCLPPVQIFGNRPVDDPPINHFKQIADYTQEIGVMFVLVPLNVKDEHWVCLLVDVEKKEVLHYDSLNLGRYHKILDDYAWQIVNQFLNGYGVTAVKAPIQQDGFSCGFFVCLKFWRSIDRTLSNDLSTGGLLTLRFELLHFLLHGEKVQ